jgi:hypothetical protein
MDEPHICPNYLNFSSRSWLVSLAGDPEPSATWDFDVGPWLENRSRRNKGRRRLGTFVPSIGGSASPDTGINYMMTFLLLYVLAFAVNVLFRLVHEGMNLESWTPSQNDHPAPDTNAGYLLVEEWEWEAPTGRRPQS